MALYGVLQAFKRVSGAALIGLVGVAIAVVGVLVYTHTIHARPESWIADEPVGAGGAVPPGTPGR